MNPRLRFKQADGTDYPDWEEKKLGELFCERVERAKGDEELLSVTIADGVVKQTELSKRNTSSLDKSNYKKVKKGDIAYNSMRMWQGAEGFSYFDGIVSPAYTVITPKSELVGKFFEYLFKTENSLNLFTRFSQGLTSDVWNLRFSALSKLKLSIPLEIEEQEKISDFLSDIDEVILASNQEVKKLQELKKGAMQKIFSQKVRFKRDDGTDYPDWEEKKLTDYLEFKNGINANRDSFGTGIKLISVSDILNNDYITYDVIRNKINIDEKTKQLYEVNYGDILFQRCSETLEEAGSANVYLDTQKAVFGGFVIRGKKIGEYNPIFFNHLLKSSSVRMEIKKKAQGAQHINIGQDLLSTIFFFIPCLEEQEKIGDFLSDFDEAISLAKQEFEKWKLLKKGILQQMFV